VEIDKRFVEYLLELSESVTGRINRGIEVLRHAAFQGLSDKYQKVGYSCNMWEPVCSKSSTEGRDFVIFPLGKAGSRDRRNTCVQLSCWSLKSQGLSGSLIQA
jgi:hypothetical protein